MSSNGAAIRLSKAVKDMRKESAIDSLSAILNAKLRTIALAVQTDPHISVLRSKFDRVGQKISGYLQQPVRITQNDDARIQFLVHHDGLGLFGRMYAVGSVFDGRGQFGRSEIKPERAGNNSRHIQNIFYQFLQGSRIALNSLEGPVRFPIECLLAQQ